MKKPVPKRLDFSHLQSTFAAITRRVNTLPSTLADQQGIPAEQPGSSHSKDLGQGNTGVNKNPSPAIERDATDGLLQKLDAARTRNYTVQSTSVTQQQKSSNSAQSIGNHGRENNVQVTQEMIQERQEEFPLPSSESEPQAEGNMEDQGGSEMGTGRPIVRATTIDEFLKENGMDVDLDGLGVSTGEQTTELHGDGEDSLALNQNYYHYVKADIDDEEGQTKKKKTRGHTTCADIYNRTMEEREEVTFGVGGPIGPTPQSVSNLTSFVGTIRRNKRFVSLLYTNWHAIHRNSKNFMWRYVNTKFILPASSEKWVIQTIRDAWKRFKGKIKLQHFAPYDNIEDMVKNRPLQEIFQSRQASGETEEEAFQSLFGKEQPGRVRCYGRYVTQTDLQRHAEISAIKQQHQEVTTLNNELGDVRTQQQQQAEEIHGLRSMVKLLLLRSEPDMRPEEIDAMLKNAQNSPVDANSGHGSTHHARNVSTDTLMDVQQD
ncbi:hypothetical protein PIB30_093240 [Stylosanthes scabra]|uniref:Transposase n=1 Tax=Stylosanthes scabra TaxID=79078 RepID=A0ABU6UXG8_9FABA|nr:hypothetical protein [Stylosanthes scabra]